MTEILVVSAIASCEAVGSCSEGWESKAKIVVKVSAKLIG